ncbi:T9SS type A sorting domain-containing protein [Pseudobacter ginsenosidimutans]|uniref:Putative secreted protein (Por secretion system target) n=1 Tax=Pseudobacter ginsenosidimutans TaxID=661488 RepID=A0A4Q7N196_9BACT|nr:T9SS type A sorting domain-containing protein [Pseudobacter ginsenosidimutans]QEC43707.1 T9SS type A sorting domain-containing protein [Pseudobacter ginsenosidimutans]RZS75113.1 putative secreted protein (Por secretion system target) [Pseudobacter ginsenosidimutans]
MVRSLSLFIFLFFAFFQFNSSLFAQCSTGMTGEYKIGPGGNYSTIQQALDHLSENGVKGNVVLELQSNYQSNVESFPLTCKTIPCSGETRTITLRPEPGAINIRVAGDDPLTIFNLLNVAGFIIDGRPGGQGNKGELSFENTNMSGNTFRYWHGSSWNQLKFLTIKSVIRNQFSGVIHFGGSDSATGNNFNRIENCDITAGATHPQNGVYSAGEYEKPNKGIVIDGCNFIDIFSHLERSYSILGGANTDSMVITNNSIYQTAPRTFSEVRYNVEAGGIMISESFFGGHLIEHNFIGGSGPKAAGSYSEYSGDFRFQGIVVVGTNRRAKPVTIAHNTIANLLLTAVMNQHSMIMIGDYMISREVYFNGKILNNELGLINDANSIRINRPEDGHCRALNLTSLVGDSVLVEGNSIGGFSSQQVSSGYFELSGIFISGGAISQLTIRNNTIRNFLNNSTSNLSGIRVTGGSNFLSDTLTIAGNLIEELRVTQSGSGSTSAGIFYAAHGLSKVKIKANKIRSLSVVDGTNYSPEVSGICVFHFSRKGSSFEYLENEIYDLQQARASDSRNTEITGIYVENANGQEVTHHLSRNYIHHLTSEDPYINYYTSVRVAGITIYDAKATTTVDNNIIFLGTFKTGKSNPLCIPFIGIVNRAGNNQYLHNTILITGESSITGYNMDHFSTGFLLFEPSQQKRLLANNIIVNNRSNAAGVNGKHSIMKSYGNDLANFVSDHNLYMCPKENEIFDGYGATRDESFSNWRALTKQDMHSFVADPAFRNSSAVLGETDLHLQQTNPAEGAGINTFTTLYDFDGQLRADMTPVDIGADAGAFAGINPQDTIRIEENLSLSAYPNPVKDRMLLKVYSKQAGAATVTVFSYASTPVYVKSFQVKEGENSLDVLTSSWPPGYYVLKVVVGNATSVIRLMK